VTYSIVARDPATGQVGAAVQTAAYSSGAGVIRAEAGVGAVATQAMTERAFGHLGLEMLKAGSTPVQAVAALVAGDGTPDIRQLGVIDLGSPPAAFTGADCVPHAEDHAGAECVAQANMMEHSGVPQAMVAAFETSTGELWRRLLLALDASQAMGGDFRGMQSAGLVVRAGERGAPAWTTAIVNVRVDDHSEPLRELGRLAELTSVYRHINVPFERIACGDYQGALESARIMSDAAPDDPNLQMRLGLALLATGQSEGRKILAGLAAKNDKWVILMRRTLQRYGIDPSVLGQPF
jgi:uncharacterized Ntn-hydrolase superfamily protein